MGNPITKRVSSDAVLVQISAGTGPREVRIFAAALARTLAAHCDQHGLHTRARVEVGEPEAPRSVALELPARARTTLAPLLGTHELTMERVRPRKGRRRGGTRKRWFVGVSVHEAPTLDASTARDIDPRELELRFDRAGGPGGQHVNTCASAVRLVHKPTRLAVRVACERSQHRNRELALERLAALLAARARDQQDATKGDLRRAHYQFERGAAVASWRFDPRTRGRLIPA